VAKARPGLAIRYEKQTGEGKGDAVRQGFKLASGDILMIYDADLTVPPADLQKFYDAIVQNRGELVLGCRLVYPMEKEAMRIINLMGNRFFSVIFSWLLAQPTTDTLCGTKVLLKANYDAIAANRHYFGNLDPFGDFDLLLGASKLGLKILEIPVRYRERTFGETNIRLFAHGWLLLRMCFSAMKRIKFM
jgi:glycosyltransferase involved in cell wall biosynthesis